MRFVFLACTLVACAPQSLEDTAAPDADAKTSDDIPVSCNSNDASVYQNNGMSNTCISYTASDTCTGAVPAGGVSESHVAGGSGGPVVFDNTTSPATSTTVNHSGGSLTMDCAGSSSSGGCCTFHIIGISGGTCASASTRAQLSPIGH